MYIISLCDQSWVNPDIVCELKLTYMSVSLQNNYKLIIRYNNIILLQLAVRLLYFIWSAKADHQINAYRH